MIQPPKRRFRHVIYRHVCDRLPRLPDFALACGRETQKLAESTVRESSLDHHDMNEPARRARPGPSRALSPEAPVLRQLLRFTSFAATFVSIVVAFLYLVAFGAQALTAERLFAKSLFQLSSMVELSAPGWANLYDVAILAVLSLFLFGLSGWLFCRSLTLLQIAVIAAAVFATMNVVSVLVSVRLGHSAAFYEHYVGELVSIAAFSAVTITSSHWGRSGGNESGDRKNADAET